MSKGRGSKGNAVAQRARRNARKQAAREAQLETAARDSAALTAIPSRTTLNPGNPTGHQARGQPSQKTSQISTTEERALASRSVYSLRGPAVEAGQKRTAEQAQLEFVAREKRRRELASTSQGPTATTSRKDSALGLGQQRMTNQEKLAPVATERPSTTSSIPAAAAENPARGLVRRMSNLQLKPHSENMIDVPSPPQQDADGDATELERENLAAAIFVPVPPCASFPNS
ncbi:hypothetical protein BU16DRAFT_119594 [Lophium mytilinum]|uniref:Uncharacterized protein n=1 Tax=Lophium mytilinum TaxID=390894 RepID=A0A6A6QHA6_9PEZI|nr:hypothetical protein BU16DRAFT_119594 [Lophium mytilinum]